MTATAVMDSVSTAARTGIRIERLGFSPAFVPYSVGLEAQDRAVDALRTGTDRGTIYLLEHEPVYTAGRRAEPEEYPTDGTPVVPVNRGGKVTWHGPGQLVSYPVIQLREKLRVVDFIRVLESVIIDTAADFGVTGFRVEGRAGVWADAGDPTPSKFAQVGIHASDGIITHGIAINCCNSLEAFQNFVPCGITDAGVTTMSLLAGRTITPADIAPVLELRLITAIEEVAA